MQVSWGGKSNLYVGRDAGIFLPPVGIKIFVRKQQLFNFKAL